MFAGGGRAGYAAGGARLGERGEWDFSRPDFHDGLIVSVTKIIYASTCAARGSGSRLYTQ